MVLHTRSHEDKCIEKGVRGLTGAGVHVEDSMLQYPRNRHRGFEADCLASLPVCGSSDLQTHTIVSDSSDR